MRTCDGRREDAGLNTASSSALVTTPLLSCVASWSLRAITPCVVLLLEVGGDVSKENLPDALVAVGGKDFSDAFVAIGGMTPTAGPLTAAASGSSDPWCLSDGDAGRLAGRLWIQGRISPWCLSHNGGPPRNSVDRTQASSDESRSYVPHEDVGVGWRSRVGV